MQAKEPFIPSSWPFGVALVGVICTWLLAPPGPGAAARSSLQSALAGPLGHPQALTWITLVLGLTSLVAYVHFVFVVIKQVTRYLGISCLTIPYARDTEVRKGHTPL